MSGKRIMKSAGQIGSGIARGILPIRGLSVRRKEFVSMNYQRFKDVFMSKRDKSPKPVGGLEGIYSLKRLAD
jgi:hypothetical protein